MHSLLATTKTRSGAYLPAGDGFYNLGSMEQVFDFNGVELSNSKASYKLSHKHIKAIISSATDDERRLTGMRWAGSCESCTTPHRSRSLDFFLEGLLFLEGGRVLGK